MCAAVRHASLSKAPSFDCSLTPCVTMAAKTPSCRGSDPAEYHASSLLVGRKQGVAFVDLMCWLGLCCPSDAINALKRYSPSGMEYRVWKETTMPLLGGVGSQSVSVTMIGLAQELEFTEANQWRMQPDTNIWAKLG